MLTYDETTKCQISCSRLLPNLSSNLRRKCASGPLGGCFKTCLGRRSVASVCRITRATDDEVASDGGMAGGVSTMAGPEPRRRSDTVTLTVKRHHWHWLTAECNADRGELASHLPPILPQRRLGPASTCFDMLWICCCRRMRILVRLLVLGVSLRLLTLLHFLGVLLKRECLTKLPVCLY